MSELPYIASRQNPTVMRYAALSDRKAREAERLFRFDGIKLFREAAACNIIPEAVLLREDRADTLLPQIRACTPESRIILLSEGAFNKISEEKAPDGVITVVKYIDKLHKIATINNITQLSREPSRIIALESVRDPGNLGTVIRSAAAFGVDTLVISADCADIYNPRTLRAAMGAIFTRRIFVASDFPAAIAALTSSGRRTLAATLVPGALPVDEISLGAYDCPVIGNEGHGLTAETVAACTLPVVLPFEASPGVESLNAATAASVFMWEGARSLRNGKK